LGEYAKAIKNWNDVDYLDNFFTKHQEDLNQHFYDYKTIDCAVSETLDEVIELESKVYENLNGDCLDEIFKPLYNEDEFDEEMVKSKLYGTNHKSWLRVYAIRLGENCYVITGSGIKLNRNMSKPHLRKELNKINESIIFLKSIGIEDDIDIQNMELNL
jgi:hypothetical protein